MRPINSSYDRMMDEASADLRALIDVDALRVGDVIDYETAEQVAEPAWRDMERELARRALRLVDEGNGHEVRLIEHDGATEWSDCSRCGARLDPRDAPDGWEGECYKCGAPVTEVGLAK